MMMMLIRLHLSIRVQALLAHPILVRRWIGSPRFALQDTSFGGQGIVWYHTSLPLLLLSALYLLHNIRS